MIAVSRLTSSRISILPAVPCLHQFGQSSKRHFRLDVPAAGRTPVIAMSGGAAKQSKEELFSTPGYAKEQDPATKEFIMQQTMYRIKDPKATVDFYSRVLGMRLLAKLDFADSKFSLIFMGYENPAEVPDDPKERAAWMFKQKGVLEFTHNWGTESDASFKGYHSGNSDPKGYGHIGLEVPDVQAACNRFEKLDVKFQKKPQDGSMKNIAFINDPDGYWIEILNAEYSKNFVQ